MIHQKPLLGCRFDKVKPYGLTYYPTLEPYISDSEVCLPWYRSFRENNSDNSRVVLNIVYNIIKTAPPNILEIGVALYDKEETITYQVLSAKDPNSIYLGIDIEDRKFCESWGINTHFLRTSSSNFDLVKKELERININKLGVIIIDGDHSVNGILNDWKFIELLSDNGIVLIHDTNTHPGPISLINSIDKTLFSVEESLINDLDHGIAIVRKL